MVQERCQIPFLSNFKQKQPAQSASWRSGAALKWPLTQIEFLGVCFHKAGAQGIEPWSSLLEREILPLNHAPRPLQSNGIFESWFLIYKSSLALRGIYWKLVIENWKFHKETISSFLYEAYVSCTICRIFSIQFCALLCACFCLTNNWFSCKQCTAV